MPNNFTRRSHHVPQKYQLGFADASGKVWIFDRKRKIYVHGVPKNIGIQNDFYTTLNQSRERSDAVEKLLADVEGKSWPLVNKLTSEEDLSETERSTIAFFTALMKTRTTAFDTSVANFTNVLAKSMLHLFNPDADTMRARYLEATGKTLSDEEAKEMFRALQEDGFDVLPHRQNTIRDMLDVATQLERALVGMEWEVYEAPLDCQYVTSDNPCVVAPPLGLDTSIQGYGPLTPGAVNIFPLDKRHALFMKAGPRRRVAFKKANRDLIRAVNVMVGSTSDRLIFASNEPLLRKVVLRCKADSSVNTFETMVASPPILASRLNTVKTAAAQ